MLWFVVSFLFCASSFAKEQSILYQNQLNEVMNELKLLRKEVEENRHELKAVKLELEETKIKTPYMSMCSKFSWNKIGI